MMIFYRDVAFDNEIPIIFYNSFGSALVEVCALLFILSFNICITLYSVTQRNEQISL